MSELKNITKMKKELLKEFSKWLNKEDRQNREIKKYVEKMLDEWILYLTRQTNISYGEEKLKTIWWFIWELKNGFTKVGEILNYPPEKVRIKIKTDETDIDFLMREDEAKGLLYGLSKVVFELGNKNVGIKKSNKK
jgi:hypothetical protein